MKSYQVAEKLLVGDRQTGDFISLLSFLDSRLIKRKNYLHGNALKSVRFHYRQVLKRDLGILCYVKTVDVCREYVGRSAEITSKMTPFWDIVPG
jgi:hypothetical protein